MLTAFQSEKLTYLFDLLDLNSNGVLQLNDFSELAEIVREKLNYEEQGKEHQAIVRKSVKFFHKLLRDMPNTANQAISLEHWKLFFEEEVVSMADEDVLDEYVDLLLAFIFGMFDENHDGYISLSEYQDIFSILGIDKNYSQAAFNKIDVNGDGRLSRYELIPAVETFLVSDKPEDAGNWVFGNWKKK